MGAIGDFTGGVTGVPPVDPEEEARRRRAAEEAAAEQRRREEAAAALRARRERRQMMARRAGRASTILSRRVGFRNASSTLYRPELTGQ